MNLKLKKEQYLKGVEKSLKESSFCAFLSSKNLSADGVQELIRKAKMKNFKVYLYRKKLLKKVEEFKDFNNPLGYLYFSHDRRELIGFLKENKILERRYLHQGDLPDQTLILKKGPTKIKAGPTLRYFEQVADVKISKGYIEYLKDCTLVQAGIPVSGASAKVLQILDKKEKVYTSKVEKLLNLNPFSTVDNLVAKYVVEDLETPIVLATKVLKVLPSLGTKTFKFQVLKKVSKLVVSLNLINKPPK